MERRRQDRDEVKVGPRGRDIFEVFAGNEKILAFLKQAGKKLRQLAEGEIDYEEVNRFYDGLPPEVAEVLFAPDQRLGWNDSLAQWNTPVIGLRRNIGFDIEFDLKKRRN